MSKRRMATRCLNLISCIIIAGALVTPVAFADDEGGQLVGTWHSDLIVRNCQTGVPLRTFAEM